MDKKKYKILLVEDEKNIAYLFRYNLTKAGYDCIVAENGRIGYNLAKTNVPDLIISDIMMPDVDGFEFRKLLLEDVILRHIPFIFLTAKGGDEDILKGYNFDIDDYIIKTASTKVVLAKVQATFKTVEKERAKATGDIIKAAGDMVSALTPTSIPSISSFKVNYKSIPYHNIPGGDFIDYYLYDKDNLVLIMGDVMGKKWNAWYFSVAYAGYVRSAIRFAIQSTKNLSPSSIIKKVNESVFEDERISEVFITLSIIWLNSKENTLHYAGAGDLPMFLKKDSVEIVKSNGMLLGFDNSTDYSDVSIEMNSGDAACFITDGILETVNSDSGEQYGEQRFTETLNKIDKNQDLIEPIIESVANYSNNIFDDDISLLTIIKN